MTRSPCSIPSLVLCALAGATLGLGGCAGDDAAHPSVQDARAGGNRPEHPAPGDQSQQAAASTLLTMALQGVKLEDQQQNDIKRIRQELHDKLEPTRVAERTLLKQLADGVAAGQIDEAKIAPAVADLATAAASSRELGAAAINRLHQSLKPDQRQALAEEVIARWSTATTDQAKSDRFGRPDELRIVIKDVDMTPDQVDQVLMQSQTSMTGSIVDPWRVDTHLERLDQFRGDKFDATAYTGEKTQFSLAVTEEAKRVMRLYLAVAPVLKPEQRAKLAQHLRDRASKPTPPLP
jgi:Spy/CpxP family protein refolding chaperone